MLGLLVAGILLPGRIAAWVGTGASTDPRNFAGSSGATYFLGATLAAGLLLYARGRTERLLALSGPVLAVLMWWVQAKGHGLVSAYGFLLGCLVGAAVLRRRRARPGGRADSESPSQVR